MSQKNETIDKPKEKLEETETLEETEKPKDHPKQEQPKRISVVPVWYNVYPR